MVDFGFMCSTLIHLCTTSLTKSFRPVWFVAQSKTTSQHCPKNHYFHIVFLNCLFVFKEMWRGALLWGNFLFKFYLTSLKISADRMEIPSPVLKIISFSSKVVRSTLLLRLRRWLRFVIFRFLFPAWGYRLNGNSSHRFQKPCNFHLSQRKIHSYEMMTLTTLCLSMMICLNN